MREMCLRKRMPENMKVSTESGKLTAMTSEAANVRRRRQQTGFRFRVMAFTVILLDNQQLFQIVTRSQKNVSHRRSHKTPSKSAIFHLEQGSLATTLLADENVRI